MKDSLLNRNQLKMGVTYLKDDRDSSKTNCVMHTLHICSLIAISQLQHSFYEKYLSNVILSMNITTLSHHQRSAFVYSSDINV